MERSLAAVPGLRLWEVLYANASESLRRICLALLCKFFFYILFWRGLVAFGSYYLREFL